jgi:predicted RND superfamily exporter protein
MVNQFVQAMVRNRGLLLGLAVVLFCCAIVPARKIGFDRRIDRMFPPEDARYRSYQDLKAWFGDSETSVIGYDDPDLFSFEGFQRLEKFHEQLEKIAGVHAVVSLKSLRRQSAPLDGRPFSQQLATHSVSPQTLRAEFLRSRIIRGRLISDSGMTPLLWIEMASRADQSVDRAKTIAELRRVCQEFDPTAVLAGGPVLVDEVFTNLERDGWTLGVASSLILTLVIALLFRNLRWILLPLAVVQVTLVWTKASLVLSGLQLSMVSSPLVALVTVIGVATIVHITVRFREERHHQDTEAALQATLRHIGPAIFWTCATTVAGFAALISSRVLPVRDFGIMMSIGASLVFVAALMLAPGFVLFLPKFSSLPKTNSGEQWLGKFLQRIAATIELHPRFVLGAVAFFVVVVGFGISRLQMATDFNENFRKESLIVKSFEFLVERVDGINAMDVLIDVPQDAIKSRADGRSGGDISQNFAQFINRIRQTQREIESQRMIAQTLSLADVFDFISLGGNTGEPGDGGKNEPADEPGWRSWLNRVPDPLVNLSDRNKLRLLETIFPSVISRFWNREAGATRIIVQGKRARGAAEKKEMIESLEQAATTQFPEARVTGSFVLMVYLMQSVMADQWISFAISICSILTMMSIAFRSIRLGFIALIPNITPILMVLGAMGWLGMKINIASAMLASVSLGLSVDFSIHYIFRYLQELRNGKSFFQAIETVQGSVGLAMVLANLALISGFLVLLLSSLIPTVHFGMLVSVAMMGGLIGNLFVLPLLLRYLDRGRAKVEH